MRSRFRSRSGHRCALVAVLASVIAACGAEDASEAGGPLLPDGAVRTFEAIIAPDRYLARDTAFSGYAEPFDVTYMILAENFEDALESHALARFRIPATVSGPDTSGTVRTDSMPVFFAGRVELHLDSITASTSPLRLELYRLVEEWDPRSATWMLRVDTADTQLAWSEPGGTRGTLIDSVTWTSPDSIVTFDIDSATIEAWRDTTDVAPGVLVRIANQGERVRASEILLRVDSRPAFHPDTVITTDVRTPDRTFVYDPPIDTLSGAPRAGGVTAWRTFIRLRERLDSLQVPCPDGPPGCTVSLRDATINYAALMFEPIAPPAGFTPEDSVQLIAPVVLESPAVPLLRSLIGGEAGRTLGWVQPPQLGGPGEPIEVALTQYMRQLVSDTMPDPTLPPTIGLVTSIQSGTFGFAAFQPEPRLRLVLSVASELLLR